MSRIGDIRNTGAKPTKMRSMAPIDREPKGLPEPQEAQHLERHLPLQHLLRGEYLGEREDADMGILVCHGPRGEDTKHGTRGAHSRGEPVAFEDECGHVGAEGGDYAGREIEGEEVAARSVKWWALCQ